MNLDEQPADRVQSPQTRGDLRFGPFRLNFVQRKLWRDGTLVALTPKEFEILVVLAENAGRPIGIDEFMRRVWTDVKVGLDNVAQQTSRLRRKLGKDDEGQDYVRNIPGVGYVLAAEVALPPEERPIAEAPRSKRTVATTWILVVGVLIVATAFLLLDRTVVERRLQVVSIRPLTRNGTPKVGGMFTDGVRVYFLEYSRHHAVPASVAVNGGEVDSYDLPLPGLNLLDMAPGPQFLVSAPNAQGEPFLWRWSPGQPPKPLWAARSFDAAWGRGAEIIESVSDRGELRWSNATTRMPLSQHVSHARWSGARGLVRFTAIDQHGENSSIWEIAAPGASPHALDGLPPNSFDGAWTSDGRRFVFLAHDDRAAPWQSQADIWALDEGRPHFREAPVPVRLTQGPLNYLAAVPSPDGMRIFALGQSSRGELVRYDQATGEFVPFVRHLCAVQTDYSRDGQWIAYASYPERMLWKMKADGSERTQLTFGRIGVHEPHWSPDGSRIAFMGEPSPGRYRLYAVSSQGGEPQELAPFDQQDQGVPTWSPDGRRIVFGQLLYREPRGRMSVRILDLDTQKMESVPGSEGVWSPRWSPDGNSIVGLSSDSRHLLLFSWESRVWRQLATLGFVQDPVWSPDSSSICFLGVNGNSPDRAYYRISIRSQKLDRLVDLNGFEEEDGSWFRITPDGTPLGVRANHVTEVFALELR